MKTMLFVMLLGVLSPGTMQKGRNISCYWRDKIEDIRSRTTDFKYSEKGQFYYFFSNDRDNLYVDLRFYDPAVRNAVLRNGVIIWFAGNNKKSKDKGIEYPVPLRVSGRPSGGGMQNREESSDAFRRSGRAPAPDLNVLDLIGFSDSGPVRVSDFEANNFRGSVHQEKDGMWYEVVMPIRKLPVITAKNKSGDPEFTLGISYRQPPENIFGDRGMPGEGGGPGRPGGGGGFGGGRPGGVFGRDGGMYGRGMPGGSYTDTPQVFWFRNMTLAAEK